MADPEEIDDVRVVGGGVIDLRYADFTSTEVDIHAYSIMGGQTILLPRRSTSRSTATA
ncbi:hypothetical protein I552_1690 [Mycobacterium xenopi 3993]|nr:hypothetical protein I552_1690 [Mycobacterium xenopi 3993]